jgi:hypothetical protein
MDPVLNGRKGELHLQRRVPIFSGEWRRCTLAEESSSRAHPFPDLVEIALQVGFELLDRLPRTTAFAWVQNRKTTRL